LRRVLKPTAAAVGTAPGSPMNPLFVLVLCRLPEISFHGSAFLLFSHTHSSQYRSLDLRRTGKHIDQANTESSTMSATSPCEDLKAQGNSAYKARKFDDAIVAYTTALECLNELQNESLSEMGRALLLNRSKAYEQANLLHLAYVDVYVVWFSLGQKFVRQQDWLYLARLAERVNQLAVAEFCWASLIRHTCTPEKMGGDTTSGNQLMQDVRPWYESMMRIQHKLKASASEQPTSEGEPARLINQVFTLSKQQHQSLEKRLERIPDDYSYSLAFNPPPFRNQQVDHDGNSVIRCAKYTAHSAIEVRPSPVSRLGVFAKRNIKEGEIFWIEAPVATGTVTQDQCDGCGKLQVPIPCDNKDCAARYCTVECKVSTWKAWHRIECECGEALTLLRTQSNRGYSSSSRLPVLIVRMLAQWLCLEAPPVNVMESNPILGTLCLPAYMANTPGAPSFAVPSIVAAPDPDPSDELNVCSTSLPVKHLVRDLDCEGKLSLLQTLSSYQRVLRTLR